MYCCSKMVLNDSRAVLASNYYNMVTFSTFESENSLTSTSVEIFDSMYIQTLRFYVSDFNFDPGLIYLKQYF